MSELCRLRQSEGYVARADDEVRVERRGKSSPDGWEQTVAVNSIRSNTVGGHKACPAVLGRWLKRAGNGTRR